MKALGLLLIIFWVQLGRAEVIEFPEEELARESVLPIFDKVEVVKNRRVRTAGRFEFGGGLGMSLTEALYDNKNFNLNASYNFTNIHGVNFMGMMMFDGLSGTGADLAAGKGLKGNRFDASFAPHPESYYILNYQVTAYYGKISLSKNYVINLTLYGLLGAVNVNFSDTSSLGFNVGFGQKIFFTPNLGLRLDLMLMRYSGPDPTSAPAPLASPVTSAQLSETDYLPIFFNFGLIYLL